MVWQININPAYRNKKRAISVACISATGKDVQVCKRQKKAGTVSPVL